MKMKKIFLTFVLAASALMLWAVPARRDPFAVEQPNGDTLIIRLIGDERWHATFTLDGYAIAQNEDGYFCYAKWEEYVDAQGITRQRAIPTKKIAKNEDRRSRCEKRWIRRHKIGKREF